MPTLSTECRDRIGARLSRLYGPERGAATLTALAEQLGRWNPGAYRKPACDHGSTVLITYGDTIQEPGKVPLRTLLDFLTTHLRGAVDCVHILPFCPYSSDDGFSVIDYREVDPALGTWEEIHAIAGRFGLMADLVLNHCSRSSLWFSDYMADRPPYNEFFVEAQPDANISMVTRPRSTPLLTEVRTHRGSRLLWTTFSADQVDLNYGNPAVLLEMLDVLLGYVAAGARIIRLDAVAYLWKEEGTDCIHLPETHEVVKLMRDVLDAVAPGCLLLTETNVPDAENRSYFGAGDEAHMVYQFPLPPLLLHALHTGRTTYLQAWAQSLEENPPPPGCTYLNFTASHDGVGLRPLEGLVPATELAVLLDGMRARGGYLSTRRKSDGFESPYELNISYFDAFRDPRVAPDPWHIPCFLMSQVVTLSMRGIPALYIHALTATPNDHGRVEFTGHTRGINRRKWDRGELEALMVDPASETGRVFNELVRILRLRRAHSAFHPHGPQRLLELGPGMFGFVREAPDGGERIFCLFNFTPYRRELPVEGALAELATGSWHDLLADGPAPVEEGIVHLAGYQPLWLVSS